MQLFLDDLCKAGDAVDQGDQVGGQYIRRIVTGTTKDGRPQYRYLRTKEEVASYDSAQSSKKKGDKDKDKDKDKDEDKGGSLKEKLADERKQSKEKLDRDPTLFLKDKTVKKSLPLYLED